MTTYAIAFLVAAELLAFVPKGYDVLDSATGDLDRDGRDDAILVLRKADEADIEEETPRPLLVLLRQSDGRLKEAGRTDRLVYCYRCGGMMGDPYQDVEAGNGAFTVSHYGGSAWRWSAAYTFAWDAAKKDWLLERDESLSFHVADEDSKTALTITREELGDIPLGSFDYERLEDGEKKKWTVVAARARFYDQPDTRSAPRAAYVVRGEVVESFRELRNFVRVHFTNAKGESTSGFLLRKDLAPVAAAP